METGGNKADGVSRRYEIIDGVLHRKTIFGEHNDGAGISRVYVPANLRVSILRNSHDSVWGGHRNGVTTFKEIVAKYYWPGMDVECQKYVSNCEPCQLAKGLKPSRRVFLSGWNNNKANQQIYMDIIGPISVGETIHMLHKEPTYVCDYRSLQSHVVVVVYLGERALKKCSTSL